MNHKHCGICLCPLPPPQKVIHAWHARHALLRVASIPPISHLCNLRCDMDVTCMLHALLSIPPCNMHVTCILPLRTYYHDEVSEYRAVKFIYQGRVIEDDNATLSQLSIGSGGAMHVHVGRPRPPGMPPQPQEPESLDLSSYFVPLFGVILAVVWVVMLLYPYVFTFISKLFLFALSLGYVILSYVSTYGE